MTVGDLEACTLGVDPGLVRLALVAVATMGTAAVVSVSGPSVSLASSAMRQCHRRAGTGCGC